MIAEEVPDCTLSFTGDKTMMKRIFNNLFSNILKYGEKSVPIQLSLTIEERELKIQLKNKVKEAHANIESNHIGLKNVKKMMSLLGGRMLCSETEQEFTVRLTFSPFYFNI